MSDIQRYDPFGFTNRGGSIDAKMQKIENGEWVKYEDYEELRAAVEMYLRGKMNMRRIVLLSELDDDG